MHGRDMKLFLKKGVVGFEPFTDDDYEKSRSVKFGEVVEVSIKKIRNYRFHCKYMVMVTEVFKNQEVYDDFTHFLTYIKIAVGHYDPYVIDGEIVKVPKSISFERMEQHEFERFYSDSIDAILKTLPSLTRKDVDRIAASVLHFM